MKDLAVKGVIYKNIFAALRAGGIFVNADTAVCATPALRDHAFRLWAEDMRPHGIAEAEAYRHFASWAREDFHFGGRSENPAVYGRDEAPPF